MQIEFHRHYIKQWSKLTDGQRQRVEKAVRLFMQNPQAAQLRLHQLKGTYYPEYSLSAGGDLRVHILFVSGHRALFVAVGTHAQLYK